MSQYLPYDHKVGFSQCKKGQDTLCSRHIISNSKLVTFGDLHSPSSTEDDLAFYLFPEDFKESNIQLSQNKDHISNEALAVSGEEEIKSDTIEINKDNNQWEVLKKVNGNDFSNFRNQWKIQVDRTRKNTTDETFYMSCKFEECPVKYKSRVAFKVQKEEEKKEDPNDDQKDNEISILMSDRRIRKDA